MFATIRNLNFISAKTSSKTLKRTVANQYTQAGFQGLLLTLAFAPFDFIFLAPFAIAFFIRLIHKSDSAEQAAKIAWIFGMVHYATSLYWICFALLVDLDRFLFVIPFAITAIPAAMATILSFVVYFAKRISSGRLSLSIIFAALYTLSEIMRLKFPVEFPWNYFGYVVAGSKYTIQLAPLGVFMLGFLFIVLSSAIVVRNSSFKMICALTFVALVAYGHWHYVNSPIEYESYALRVVQPNFQSHHLGVRSQQEQNFRNLAELSTVPSTLDLSLVIWPESSYPFLFRGRDAEVGAIASLTPRHNGYGELIFGADRRDEERRFYNSVVTIASNKHVKDIYDKRVLVPFGEYVPFNGFFGLANMIVPGYGEFSRGQQKRDNLVSVAGNYLPLICYEIAFPSLAEDRSYDWILNVTNDSWFGQSSGVYQHMAIARFRAAETGLPVVRAATTGISAVIAPNGDVIADMPLNYRGFIDSRLPKKDRKMNFLSQINQIYLIISIFFLCIFREISLKRVQ